MKQEINISNDENSDRQLDELELYQLMVTQLQKELEKLYVKYTKEIASQRAVPTIQNYSIPYMSLEYCEIIDFTADASYADVSLQLNGLILSENIRVDKINCKLISINNRLGLMLRNNNNDDGLVNWPAEMKDEYGQYIMFLPENIISEYAYKESMFSTLSTKDRQLIVGIISAVRDCFIQGGVHGVSLLKSEELKRWRKSAVLLANIESENNQFLTVNNVILTEALVIENYEHLAIQLEGLKFGIKYYPKYKFRLLLCTDPISGQQELILGFRDQKGNSPLEAWPPIESDEFGSICRVSINKSRKKTLLSTEDELTSTDKNFISQLTLALPEILSLLETSNTHTKDGWDVWKKRIDMLIMRQILVETKKNGVIRKIMRRLRVISFR